MNHDTTPPAPLSRSNTATRIEMESTVELQSEIESLRMLICDLLHTNQQLRLALLAAGHSAAHHTQSGLPPSFEHD